MKFGFFGRKDPEEKASPQHTQTAVAAEAATDAVLRLSDIRVGCQPVDKDSAIRAAGRMLVEAGCVREGYIEAMLEREKVLNTYIGEGVAIPHGVGTARDQILRSGICIMQYPEGVVFGEGKLARLVVGIAGKGGEHMDILANLAEIIMDKELLGSLFATGNAEDIYAAFVGRLQQENT